MVGQRVETFEALSTTPGAYMKDEPGEWWAHVPNSACAVGQLADHEVTEHEDGTITVAPSILMPARDGSPGYHGYLERGVWREC